VRVVHRESHTKRYEARLSAIFFRSWVHLTALRAAPFKWSHERFAFGEPFEISPCGRNDGRFARKKVCEVAASPPPHTPPYLQWHGVISTAGRNLVIYLLFDFFDGGLETPVISTAGRESRSENPRELAEGDLAQRSHRRQIYKTTKTTILNAPPFVKNFDAFVKKFCYF